MNPETVKARPAIGIFGGTFDPVHYGHLRAALETKEKLGLDDFRLLPAGTPALRSSTFATPSHRLAMLQLAVRGHSGFSVDDREIRRRGKSFMVDSLLEIREESGSAPLMLVIGQDAANELDRWHRWRSLFDLAHLVVMQRPDSKAGWRSELRDVIGDRLVDSIEPLRKQPAGCVLPLTVTQLAISSTGIRALLSSGRSARYLLPEPVLEYIERNKLYFAAQPPKG